MRYNTYVVFANQPTSNVSVRPIEADNNDDAIAKGLAIVCEINGRRECRVERMSIGNGGSRWVYDSISHDLYTDLASPEYTPSDVDYMKYHTPSRQVCRDWSRVMISCGF